MPSTLARTTTTGAPPCVDSQLSRDSTAESRVAIPMIHTSSLAEENIVQCTPKNLMNLSESHGSQQVGVDDGSLLSNY